MYLNSQKGAVSLLTKTKGTRNIKDVESFAIGKKFCPSD
jgi:hypothetical protein